MEHTWFLTEMSKRKLEAAQNAADAIEEGHETDEEEDDASDDDGVADKAKQDNQLLSDDDPLSPFSCDDLKSPSPGLPARLIECLPRAPREFHLRFTP